MSDVLVGRNMALFNTPQGAALDEAIEALYSSFSWRSLDEAFSVCPHCYTDETLPYLKDTPVRSLIDGDAAYLLNCVGRTIGKAAHVNYFLPRLLEAMAYGVHYMPHVIPSAVARGREEGWKNAELDAVVAFLKACFTAVNGVADDKEFWIAEFYDTTEELRAAVPEAANAIILPEI